jgi:hypothetical protein
VQLIANVGIIRLRITEGDADERGYLGDIVDERCVVARIYSQAFGRNSGFRFENAGTLNLRAANSAIFIGLACHDYTPYSLRCWVYWVTRNGLYFLYCICQVSLR